MAAQRFVDGQPAGQGKSVFFQRADYSLTMYGPAMLKKLL